MNTFDLYQLHAQHNGSAWVVGFNAEREILLARDAGGFYLVAPPNPREETKLLGLPVRLDRGLPTGRIELRDQAGRVLGAIEGVGE